MKKNISINISGIIFHIEEDGYEALRKYLDSINQYFGSFADSSEILSDIESRIAEIFLSKLNEGKQVITAEDVQSLITIMGSVNDFRAAEEQELNSTTEQRTEQNAGQQQSSSQSSTRHAPEHKKLFRDKKRKIFGGVCAGLGHYFNIDPVWPRLLFALAVLGTSGVLMLLYFILWIALPVSEDLEDEPSVKKMYRNPDGKVVGGVASGVASFFGSDVTVIRLLFVVFTIFFGTGLVVYVVLWIALPEAKTITEKMQMQGEPVTLSNIESSVKKSLNENHPEESLLAKIILFPFRVLAAILNGLGKILGPFFFVIFEIFRMTIGIAISLVGVALIISLLIAAGIIFGAFSVSSLPEWWQGHVSTMNLPFENIRHSFPLWTGIFAFVALVIPSLFIQMIGNSIIAKRIVFKPVFGWTLLVLFFISVVFLSFSVPQLIYTFKEDADYKVEKMFVVKEGKPVLKLKETGLDDYNFTGLSLRGYDGTNVKLIERFTAQGVTKMNARENAEQVTYNVDQADSVLTFDSNIAFNKDAPFRFQRLFMELYIPYETPFVIDEDMWGLIDNFWRYDYNRESSPATFKLTKAGKLECVSCPPPPKDMSGLSSNDQFGLKDFNELEMSGLFDLVIQQGPEFAIQLEGTPAQKDRYTLNVKGETLEVEFNTKNKNFWKDAGDQDLADLTITMPTLRKLKLTGAGKIKIRGFNEQETDIKLVGALSGDIRISANQLSVETAGPVILDLEGEGDFLEASISGPSQLKASGYHVNRATVEAKGLAQARVHVTGSLEIDKDFTSTVHYTGTPEIVKHE